MRLAIDFYLPNNSELFTNFFTTIHDFKTWHKENKQVTIIQKEWRKIQLKEYY